MQGPVGLAVLGACQFFSEGPCTICTHRYSFPPNTPFSKSRLRACIKVHNISNKTLPYVTSLPWIHPVKYGFNQCVDNGDNDKVPNIYNGPLKPFETRQLTRREAIMTYS